MADEVTAIAQATSEQTMTLRFAESEYRTIIPYLEDILTLIRTSLRKRKKTVSDIEFTRELQKSVTEILRDWDKLVQGDLKEFTAMIIESTADGVEMVVNDDAFNAAVPATNQVYSAALNTPMPVGQKGTDTFLKDIFKNFPPVEANRAVNQVRAGFMNGLTNSQITQNVADSLDITNNHARTIVRTATSKLSAQAKEMTFNDNDDVISALRFVATLDLSTTKICKSLDGTVWKLNDKKKPSLPLHYNERSTYAPVIEGEDLDDDGELKRPAITAESKEDGDLKRGQVSSQTKYYNMLKNQPKWYIDKALGSQKEGKAFRALVKSGEMTPEKWAQITINQTTFQPLTLEEMAKNNKQVNNYLKSLNKAK